MKRMPGTKFSFIERNFLSKKIKYGWDNKNEEAYNNLEVLKNFLISNKFQQKNFTIYNYDIDQLPMGKFDVIISLYSLDFHYNFEIYQNYLKKVFHQNTPIWKNIKNNSPFYFVHSYRITNTEEKVTTCKTIYQNEFISFVEKENLFGSQFHPEKSHITGLKLIKNFLELKN